MTIKGKVALITGASFGIGEMTAHAFAKAGATVIISARTESKLLALKERLMAEYDASVHVLSLDVSDRASVKNAMTTLPDEFASIDILVNNAGLALGIDKIQDADLDDWDTMIDVNVKGLLYVTHYALQGMVARNSGHIVNIGSISAHSVYSGGAVYCGTKYAVKAITDGLKRDLHEFDIRVTQIDPGMVDTEFSTVRFKGDSKRAEDAYKGFEPLAAQDVADAILYAVNCPPHVDVRQMLIIPSAQTDNGLVHKKDD